MAFGIIAPIVGAAVGIYGANKQANAAKSAQQERNNATEAQYTYNKEKWAMDKQKMLADRDYKVREIEKHLNSISQSLVYSGSDVNKRRKIAFEEIANQIPTILEKNFIEFNNSKSAFKLGFWFENFSPEIDYEQSYLWYSVSVSG